MTRWLSHPRILRLVAAVSAAAILIVVAIYGWSDYMSDTASAARRDVPHTDVNPYGANFFLDLEVEAWKREKTVQMAQAAGIGWAKQSFAWEAIEPKTKGRFVESDGRSTWQKYDEMVDLFARNGIQVIARLDRPPAWSRVDNRYPQAPPDRFEDYGDFVYEFVNHYKGKIRYIQIWNEPNIFPEWGARPVSPTEYARLLKIAYTRAKQADPNIVVLSAPLAMTLENFPDRHNLSDLAFLEEMYQAGVKDNFDILSSNAFGFADPPTAPADPDRLNFQRVTLQRAIMEKYGDGNKPIWFNEYGWNAAPSDFPDDELTWKRVEEPQQAQYTVDGIRYARENWPWAGVFNNWYFRQVGDKAPDRADYYFRMVDVDFTPRTVYQAVKEATAALRTAGDGHYEETSVPVASSGGWQMVLAPQASGGAYINSDRPGAALTFQFQGETIDLLTSRGPETGRCLVTIDGQPVAGLPRDARGRSYIELYQGERQWQARDAVAHDLGRGPHTLQLIVAEGPSEGAAGPRCAIDGFEVVASHPSLPAGWLALLLGLFVGATGLLYVRRRRA